MVNHGVSTGALFMLLGMIYDRRHTYDIEEYGGLATPMPIYATFFAFIMLSSVGLPLLNGFIGEFMVLSGAFQAKQLYGILAATGVIWSACYLLWMYQRVFYGEVKKPVNASLRDLDAREQVSLWPLATAALAMGVAPMLWLHSISPSVSDVLKTFSASTQASVSRTDPQVRVISAEIDRAKIQRRVTPVKGHGFSRAVATSLDMGFSPEPRLKPISMLRDAGGLKSASSAPAEVVGR
jgi:NADH-quinone oxidoreductase subunit M